MLHRMTTLLSAVVVAFVAANALNAVSPAIAQAVERAPGGFRVRVAGDSL